jgi:hypothetical protein
MAAELNAALKSAELSHRMLVGHSWRSYIHVFGLYPNEVAGMVFVTPPKTLKPRKWRPD